MSVRVSGEPAMLVAGGSGGVGRAIVAALLKRETRVIVPLRQDASEARLRDYLRELPLERLTLLRGEIADVADGHRIATSLRNAYGQLDGVAAALGGWWTGEPLVELRRETWNKLVTDNLTAHLAVVQAFFPLLREAAGRYVAHGLYQQMRVISIKRLRAFWEEYLDAKAPLSAWYKIAKTASWKSIAEVRLTYPHADFLDPYTVFNIKGNDYRLIVKIKYGGQLIFIHRVLIHVEYDKDAWK